jgi:hypothetical protein
MDDDWECGRCTLRNDGDACACAACGAARGAASSPASSLADSESDASGSEGDEYDDFGGLDGPDDSAYTVSIHVAKRKWEETEARRVAGRAQGVSVAGRSHEERQAAKSQIFSSPVRPLCRARCESG